MPVALQRAAHDPRIISMSITPSQIEIAPGVDQQAIATVEVEVPAAGLPPELNPGANVTVSLHRVDVTPVLVDRVACCPGVCCRTEFIPQGKRRTFVFTLKPVDATVAASRRE